MQGSYSHSEALTLYLSASSRFRIAAASLESAYPVGTCLIIGGVLPVYNAGKDFQVSARSTSFQIRTL